MGNPWCWRCGRVALCGKLSKFTNDDCVLDAVDASAPDGKESSVAL